MNAPGPVSAEATRVPDPQSPEAFTPFLFAMKDWQQSDFPNAAALLEQFGRSESAGAYGWINDYKPLAEKFLADYRVFAEWQKQSQGFAGPEQITAALTALKAAQGKLQLRGRLNEAFKEEEAKLLRQMDERKKRS